MAKENESDSRPDHRLSVEEVLDDLVADGIITSASAQTLRFALTPKERGERHALEVIADAKLHHLNSKRVLTLEELTYWLAKRTGLDYLRIDPLKIDAPNVGDLVTASYAAWNRMLPVAITPERAVFATSEPYLTGWVDPCLHRGENADQEQYLQSAGGGHRTKPAGRVHRLRH